MVIVLWQTLLSFFQNLDHIHTQEASCLAKFDVQRTCAQSQYYRHARVTNVTRSIIDCSSLCCGDPYCRSFQFNPINNECQTYMYAAERATHDSSCDTLIRHGEMQKSTCTGHWLFEPCSNDNVSETNCLVANSSCLDGRCECIYGYPYDHRTGSCTTGCAKYGKKFRQVHYYIASNNKASYPGIGLKECVDFCLSATDFVCRLLEFDPFNADYGSSMCTLSEVTALTAPDGSLRAGPENNTHLERFCA